MEQLLGTIFVGGICLSFLCYFMYGAAIIAPNMRDNTTEERSRKDEKTKKICIIVGICSILISIISLSYGIHTGILH